VGIHPRAGNRQKVQAPKPAKELDAKLALAPETGGHGTVHISAGLHNAVFGSRLSVRSGKKVANRTRVAVVAKLKAL
jgi:hypothetical protein